ncbi:hypothetical protein [Vibrio salilacus]|uniref:hypothetical protein n=1 Tax=Vibrio salilacus TaxID=1323749 RepID=UPI0012FD3808|nr:hypothetical protein [Vibrio salilacus]
MTRCKRMPYLLGALATNDGKVIQLKNDQLIIVPLHTTVIANGKSIATQSVVNCSFPYWQSRIET